MNSMADAANGAIESIGRAFNDLLFKVLPVLNEIEGRFRRTWGSIVKIGSIFGLVKDPEAKGRSVNVTKTPEQLIGGLILKGFDKGMENFMRPDPVPYKPAPFVGGTHRPAAQNSASRGSGSLRGASRRSRRDAPRSVVEGRRGNGIGRQFCRHEASTGPRSPRQCRRGTRSARCGGCGVRKDAAKGKLSDLELPNLAKNLATQVVGTFNGLNASQGSAPAAECCIASRMASSDGQSTVRTWCAT